MPWGVLLILLIGVWFLESVAAATARAVAAKRRGTQQRTGGGVSLMPGLVVMPALFLGIALGVDYVASPWGTRIIALLHAALGVACVIYIVWASRCINAPS